jgi:acyl carrier protein
MNSETPQYMTERQVRIHTIVKQLSPVAGANPGPSEQLFESGILDSFGLPDLVSVLEKEFSVRVPDSELLPANFASIQAIDTYLARRSA